MEQPKELEQPTKQKQSEEYFVLFKRWPVLRWQAGQKAEIIEPEDQTRYSAFADDFKVLEQEVMEEFRDLDTKAQRGQNQFRLEQVILILGGVLVTALGAGQVTFAAILHNSLAPGLAEAVLAAALAGFARYAGSSKSQETYFSNRLKAEALRGEYFRFLGRLDLYADGEPRQQHLRQRVVEITTSNDLKKLSMVGATSSHPSQQGSSNLSEQEQLFWELYQKHRHHNQRKYYSDRRDEYEKAQGNANILNIALMTLAAIVSLLGSANLFNFSTGWALFAIIFPLLATALSAYESVYAFERQAKLFNDAATALRYVEAFQSPQANDTVSLKDYVKQVESILTSEQGQWGQLISQIDPSTITGNTAQPGSSSA